jgi:cysteine desulfurase
MEKGLIHLDTHSTSSISTVALDRMVAYLHDSAISRADLELRYQSIYELVGASLEDRFVLTTSSAEAVNQVLWSIFLEVGRKTGKCHFVASTLEDAPTMQMLKRLEDLGCFVKFVSVNERGQIDLKQLEELMTPRTACVSVTVAHGLTGVIQPVEEICHLAQQKGILLHLDAAYALGKYDLSTLEPDYITFSGERIHASKHCGGLFAKKGAPLSSLIVGGTEQGGLRAGTLDLPSLMALSAAASQITCSLDAMNLEMIRLRDLLEAEIQQQIPRAEVLFQDVLRLPNTTVVIFPKVHQEALLYLLEKKGVFALIGGSHFQHLHRLLQVRGDQAISFSIDRMTREDEIRKAVSILAEQVHILSALSEDL